MGWPGAPVWGSALVMIPDAVHSHFGGAELLEASKQHLHSYMDYLARQSAFAPGKILPQFGLLGDWLSLDPICPGCCAVVSCWMAGMNVCIRWERRMLDYTRLDARQPNDSISVPLESEEHD